MEFLTTGFNVLLIILGFGLLIFVHELGHFIAAKWAGIRTEAFAVGMGPVALAWRKGIGLRFGSTAAAYEQRVVEHIKGSATFIAEQPHDGDTPELPQAEMYRIGDQIGLGETEYSLRWLPIGGFVKMLGQEDANPNYVSNDPRSYTRCSIGKRMIVVSAGVIMNILLAMALFIIAFMVGVRFEAPVVGEVIPDLPAATTRADNAAALGVESPGLQPGDEVIKIDGKAAHTFADLQIASAMSKPGVPVKFTVVRAGVAEPLTFSVVPEKDPDSGLLSVGIIPGASTTLHRKDEGGVLDRMLRISGLASAGVKPGMRIISVDGQEITTFGQFSRAADASMGKPLQTTWRQTTRDGQLVGDPVHATLQSHPMYQIYPQQEFPYDEGLLGVTPLARIAVVTDESPNKGMLLPGDVIIRIGDVQFPRRSQIFEAVETSSARTLTVGVLRDGQERIFECTIQSKKLGLELELADDLMLTGQPIVSQRQKGSSASTNAEYVQTPIASAKLFTTGGTLIHSVNDQPVNTWQEFRETLRSQTTEARDSGSDATIELLVTHPTPGREQQQVAVQIPAADVKALHALGWSLELPSFAFEPIQIMRTADGNALKAISMGFSETGKLVVMTYLTIDRLFRGSVGVEQLRGPVGIVHIGSKVAERGFMYIIFFLGMISVNLAVINFLPMPIVDGGLFLFLVYEKLKGRPPSIAFQNAATVVGICFIATMFLVVTWNDVWRLIS